METCPPRPLRAEDVPGVEAWFDDPETQRWLGGREWPRRLLNLAAAPDRFGVHRSVADLNTDIRDWLDHWNENPRPYVWVKTADEILTNLARYCNRISATGH